MGEVGHQTPEREQAVTPNTQPDLFDPAESIAPAVVGLFAEVVFDRPLDHPYTYGVPDALRGSIAVGKRVETPFGRGDRETVGFCVNLTETAPDRPVKHLTRVLDEEPLLTPNLLRLTRWMADYYMCGWGQVLNVVVPAGAKQNAGTRTATFVEAVPLEGSRSFLRAAESRSETTRRSSRPARRGAGRPRS